MSAPTNDPPLIRDVARLAGVAPITVSRVVNRHPSVRPETRARVQRAIDELGYRANMAARTLAGGRSRVVGAVVADAGHFGPAQTLLAIDVAAREAGRSLMLSTVPNRSAEEWRNALDRLLYAHVDGVIVINPFDDTVDVLTELSANTPMVMVSAARTGNLPGIGIDQGAGAATATRHLLSLGHATVHHVRGARGWIDADLREDAWRRVLLEAGAPVPPVIEGDWSAESGHAAGRRLAADPDVTAVFASNDQMALGVVLALEEAGRRVPADVSVVGFDDLSEAAFFRPPLTTVRQDFAELGHRAIEMLASILDAESAHHVLLEPEFRLRASTAPAGGRSGVGTSSEDARVEQ